MCGPLQAKRPPLDVEFFVFQRRFEMFESGPVDGAPLPIPVRINFETKLESVRELVAEARKLQVKVVRLPVVIAGVFVVAFGGVIVALVFVAAATQRSETRSELRGSECFYAIDVVCTNYDGAGWGGAGERERVRE